MPHQACCVLHIHLHALPLPGDAPVQGQQHSPRPEESSWEPSPCLVLLQEPLRTADLGYFCQKCICFHILSEQAVLPKCSGGLLRLILQAGGPSFWWPGGADAGLHFKYRLSGPGARGG